METAVPAGAVQGTGAGCISGVGFASMMDALGPFESNPYLGVAVSGGGDSMALVLLAHDWARGRGGRVTALTVDHGLRPESAAEAEQVAAWLEARGIGHRVLAWTGSKPASGLQAAARQARYLLLGQWARDAGVLHLLLGHNREDQAETFLMRLEKGSGDTGLAAMAAVTEAPAARLLRPLLRCRRENLRATLRRAGQPWIEDPSNRNRDFARIRVRGWLPALDLAGMPASRLAAAAARCGEKRVRHEQRVSAFLARHARVFPAGYAEADGTAFSSAGEADEVSRDALGRLLTCIGGGAYAPRRAKLETLYRSVAAADLGGGRTLAGCRILPWKGRILVCRETRLRAVMKISADGGEGVWDGRFRVRMADPATGPGSPYYLGFLAGDGWAEVLARRPEMRQTAIPPAARSSLPAVRDGEGVAAVPHLGYQRPGTAEKPAVFLDFRPANSLGGVGFHVA